MNQKYVLIIRTGQAEIKAIENLDNDVFTDILPLIELTRGRKKTIEDIVSYPFEPRFLKLKDKLKGKQVAIDVTSEEGLSCEETDRFYNFENGYECWVNYLLKLKKEKIFKSIIPSLIINFEDNSFEDNLKKEIHLLVEEFGSVLYRCSLEDAGCYEDLSLIQKEIGSQKLYILIDCGYMVQAMQNNVAAKCIARIKNLREILKCNFEFIICGTSFPNNISEIGNDETDTFSISEIFVFEACKKIDRKIIYGDYGSINPIRNDNVIMARGWIPRIDVPLEKSVYYYRQRRPSKESKYNTTYKEVALKVMKDTRFPIDLNAWGISMIKECANGVTPSSSPSFWISVRMNIHIMQQLKRL